MVVLYSMKVDFKGRRVDAIRIDPPNGSKPKGNKKAPVDDEEAPF